MSYPVYLRPLNINDAKKSCFWRNDPDVWRFTEFRPDKYITYEIEKEWLANKLKNTAEARFAICLKENDLYIGNAQLLNIDNRKGADFHLFIGEVNYWGKGIGTEATSLILHHAFYKINLNQINLKVHKNNIPAQTLYLNKGFKIWGEEGDFIKMALTKTAFEQEAVSSATRTSSWM